MPDKTIKTEPEQTTNAENLLESIKDPGLKKTLGKLWNSIEQSENNGELQKIKNEITKSLHEPEQQIFSFLPHQMAKTSIFFPMSDKELTEDKRKISRLEQETSWGKITIEGIKLAIFEEDIFLAIMKIAREKLKYIEGQYILETKMKEIIHILYGTSYYSPRKVLELILRTLDNFQLVRFEITLFEKLGYKKVKENGLRGSIGNIIQSYYYDPKTDNLTIKLNPDFCKLFLESMLTNINLTLRRKLKKDGSKALLRFLCTHNEPGKMHILTVLNAINYNINQPLYLLRRKFKQFIAELKKNGVLGTKTKLLKDDVVYFDINPQKNPLIGK